jgi:cyclophilin family peptidyl-prolyl cis-trans isomerase
MPFYKVVKDYFVFSGDPYRTGTGGESGTGCGYKFNDDLPITRDYVAGSLVMVNSGPNTNGSMFAITVANLSDNSSPYYTEFKDKTHVIFGLVQSGLDVATKLSEVDAFTTGHPLDPNDAYIVKITITEK